MNYKVITMVMSEHQQSSKMLIISLMSICWSYPRFWKIHELRSH